MSETTTDRLAEIEGQAGAVTSDDVAAEALAGVNEWPNVQTLQRKLETTEAALLEQQQRNEQLVTQGSQQHMQIAELRSEVSHVQGLLGESRKAVNSADRDKADLQHRLDTVAAEWAVQSETIRGLQAQLESVKAEVVQERLERNQWQNHAQRTETQLVEKVSECRNLRIELDALQQAPQAETVAAAEAVSDRFEQGWDAGTARAVETIAEWTEPFRQMIEKADNLVESDRASRLCAEIMQSLPAIMRSLTGLSEED